MLGQLQYWADAFKGKPQLIAVEEMYEQMKAEGVEFPPIDLDSLAPIETPTSRVHVTYMHASMSSHVHYMYTCVHNVHR